MDDYAALLERVCFTLPKVMGCVLLSDDGLVLSAYPDDGHSVAETAWLHFSALDEPLRGFLTFSDQVWAYVRHGAYAAFVVAESGVRGGVLLDQLEQVLTTIDVPPADAPRAREAPSSAHEPPRRPVPVPNPLAVALAGVADAPAPPPEPDLESESEPESDQESEPESEPEPASVNGVFRPVHAAEAAEDDEAEIDRVQLAQEFSGLLQMHRADDEASS